MCCIRGICILAPGANVSANPIFHPVQADAKFEKLETWILPKILPSG